MKRIKVSCDQCEMVSINGIPCHEHGCPNSKKKFVDGEWVKVFICRNCDREVLEGESCCEY